MKRILIGHRGVGKSSLAQRLSIYQNLYGEPVPVYDLDREIEKMSGTSITEIFALMGEKAFRDMEAKTLTLLLRQKNYIVALGAGFPLDSFFTPRPFDKDLEIIWVRRPSDELGRIFLDRPRLNPELSAMQEFHQRSEERNQVYKDWAHWIYDLPEGQSFPSEVERAIFSNSINGLTGGMTILPEHASHFESFKSRQWRWDLDFFELRDDLLTDEELQKFFVLLEKNQILISFRRKSDSTMFREALAEGYRADWPLEMAQPAPAGIQIISVHDRGENETLFSVMDRLEKATSGTQMLKLAVEINDYVELEAGLHWQGMDPARRSFLPRSKNGKWSWVRAWLKDRQYINFIREGSGSSSDQPTLTEWMAAPTKSTAFAAVLGSPVIHSFSPVEHRECFRKWNLPFFAIDIQENEWPTALPLLTKLGLSAAAVTSPLKKLAFVTCAQKSALSESFGALNTIWRNAEGWSGDNTDYVGFRTLLESLGGSPADLDPIVIWGGGGTLPVLKACLPTAHAYSVTKGQPRSGESPTFPKTLIWAGSPTGSLPPTEWRPRLVIDLNYRDDSLAKEYGQRVGARYISGLPMFKSQASAQQAIWQKEFK